MQNLQDYIKTIDKVDTSYGEKTRALWDNLVHPIGSLGQIEKLTIKIASMTRKEIPTIEKRALIVMAGDNGIYDENVSSGYDELTSRLIQAMAEGYTGAAALAKWADMDLYPVDLGSLYEMQSKNIIKKRHRPRTSNFMLEPAMTEEEVEDCISVGIELAEKLIAEGVEILATGELGIANTTTSSAVEAALLKTDGKTTCGFGAGIDSVQMQNKIRVVDEAIKKYDLYNKPALEVLRCVGGYDIAGLVGVFLAGAKNHVPIVIDGFISASAALIATRLNENVKGYLLASHMSCEKQVELINKELGVKPVVHMEMRLGEGSGCPLLIKLLDGALYALNNMGKFSEVSIMGDILVNIREDD